MVEHAGAIDGPAIFPRYSRAMECRGARVTDGGAAIQCVRARDRGQVFGRLNLFSSVRQEAGHHLVGAPRCARARVGAALRRPAITTSFPLSLEPLIWSRILPGRAALSVVQITFFPSFAHLARLSCAPR